MGRGGGGGDESDRHASPNFYSGAGISARHDRRHVTAAGVEPGDRRRVLAQDLSELVGEEATAWADIGGMDGKRLEMRLLDRAHARIEAPKQIAQGRLICVAS